MILKNKKRLKKEDFKNEKELQRYFEENLEEILNLEFVTTEFPIDNYRMDTIAFDKRNNSFKIIEFKNIKNKSMVDQGLAYFNVLKKNKAHFILEYNEVKNKTLKISDVNWNESKVIFVSPAFTSFQLDATLLEMLPIELYKATKYEEEIVLIESITNDESDDSILTLTEIKPNSENKRINQPFFKWGYNNKKYTNKKLVIDLMKDYLMQLNPKRLEDIPEEVRDFSMQNHELIRTEPLKGYDYTLFEINNMKLYIRSYCPTNNTQRLIEFLKQYFVFEVEILFNGVQGDID